MFWKAFNKGLICRGKQYKENTVYEEEGGNICSPGMMHFCDEPFNVLNYYNLVDEHGEIPEFATVESLEAPVRREDKLASKKIKIGNEVSFYQFINAGIRHLIAKTKHEPDCNCIGNDAPGQNIASSYNDVQIGNSGYAAHISNSGMCAIIGNDSECSSISNSGHSAQICDAGYASRIANAGNKSRIASDGKYANISTSGDGCRIASFGEESQITSSGEFSMINMQGDNSVAVCVGFHSAIKGKIGCWITLAEWHSVGDGKWVPVCVKTGKIDGKELLPDTWYRLKNGEFTKIEEN